MARKTSGKKTSTRRVSKPARSAQSTKGVKKAAVPPHSRKTTPKTKATSRAKAAAKPAPKGKAKPTASSKVVASTPTGKAKLGKSAAAEATTKPSKLSPKVAPKLDAKAAAGTELKLAGKSGKAPAVKSAEKPAKEEGPVITGPLAVIQKLAKAQKTPGKGGKRSRSVAEAATNIVADAKGYVFINGRRVRMISTKGQSPIKKPRPNGVADAQAAAEPISIKSIKTKLSRKELNHYRELLVMKRRELVGDLHAMETAALRSGSGNLSHMPIHMADIGTDVNDQDLMLGLAETERSQLREIDAALQRIDDRSYGICQMTGQPIPKTRLDAKPWAKHSIEAARKLEGQWRR